MSLATAKLLPFKFIREVIKIVRKFQAIDIISRAANMYDKQMNQKNLLIIFGNLSKPNFIETQALPRNFLHLTGVELNKDVNNNSPEKFF